MRAKAFNPQIFLEFLCYSVFGVLMVYLVRSGKYLSYVTPRMKPYLYFTAAVMLVWAYAGLRRVFRPQHKIRTAHCFVLVIPALFLLLPHSALSTADLSTNYVSGNSFSQQNTVTTTPDNSVSDSANSAASDTQADTPDDHAAGLPGMDAANKKITVGNDEFYPWLDEIYTNMDKYEGYTIAITGYVFKDPEYFAKDEFVPARLAMTCCAADLSPIGILCKYEKASELTADTWVTVEGVFHKGQNEGQGEPQLTVTKITPAEKVEGYIYPSY